MKNFLIDRKIAIEEQKRFSNKITERMRTARAVSQAAKQFNDLIMQYDVFLSFRGTDIRSGVLSHLIAALSNAGVNTFEDEKFERGERIMPSLLRAIAGSKIHIILFSNNYASSKWCLDELVKIMECHRTYGNEVLPVFYNVDPSDVRNQRGDFGQGLEALAQRYLLQGENDVLKSWKSALNEAANLAGWVSRNYRTDADLVEDIVEDIIEKLDMHLLPITDFPVGLESRVPKLIKFVDDQSGRGCVIGIWGMGGLGKTTIAKSIYNEFRRQRFRRSFIETNNKGHTDLQEKLLSDVLKTKVKIHSVAMGISMIEKKLFAERALIILDDVTEFEQLKALCGNCKWIDRESVLIITTRDLRLLEELKDHHAVHIWKIMEMDENESLELFSKHAFREASPTENWNKLSIDVVAYCAGLPLALEILGSYLRWRTKEEWESVLSKLKKIPNYKVQEKLRISFDGLRDPMEKDIFLDVCCFFIGKDRTYVTEILDGCGLHASIGIKVLIEHSLIKVEKNKLGMHPLLRDMGREIVCESSKNEPGKRNRLWFQKDVLDVLTNNTGTETIQGLAVKLHFTSRDSFEAYSFEKMKGLRLLQLDHVQLSGNYGYLSKQLKWICWRGFPLKYIPNNFHLEGVIAIDFKYSKLRLLWKTPQVLPWLKFLNLSHSKNLTETPDFSKLTSLEKLILKNCPSLCKVHQSIGDLHNLILINLKGCTSLRNLPREVYKLKSVKILILSGCSKIDKLEEDIVQMESLTTLIADNTAVKQVPFSIVSSKSIGYISLCGFEGLSRNVFPSIIWSWMSPTMNPLSYIGHFYGTSSSLVSMDIHNNNFGDLAPTFRSLSNLRSVLVQCDTQIELSKLCRTILDDINGSDFTELRMTPYISQFSKHSLRSYSYLIGIGTGTGTYQEVFTTLNNSISKELATNVACDVSLPADNYPFWLAHTSEGHSVYFTVPEDCRLKGMILCVVYLSTPEIMASECLISVLIVNYTKCTIQIHKRDTVISFNDEDWQGIISHLGPGDEVEIFVTFGHRLVVKKTAVYLTYGESIDMEIEPSPEQKENALIRFIKKIVTCDFW
ncbi:hypothetical protein AAZX31_16G078000 [Glycine max]|uniref:TIR domain-containing protein n=1 Tax=Glycine max TaxID=3847 RepID=A0A0R0E307_SOYBN|eukprot:XP_014628748.1 protein SUPPRESSOR OF npr1-1, CONSTITUTIVE 1 isoform X1 [Glycine max]